MLDGDLKLGAVFAGEVISENVFAGDLGFEELL